ncbi:MAG: UDP-N-acetylmuramoyl-tripeptide--D-alanyl-D-alanine ligase [Bacteroidetes bacterium]|nr:UDP-N-acetylmuramoyl-tripeptide--D-alanyl-D-alanine ligase [Bacteroidota bacterium]
MNIIELYDLFLKSTGVTTDSRVVKGGDIFFALRDKQDGNQFASGALEKGCTYAVIDNPLCKKDDRYILVENALHTLQELARFHRRRFNIPVIAITGSNGKTTTKELAARVLSKQFRTLSTRGNLNNHIGVPLTLLSLKKRHEIAVIEMGTNHQGEIRKLCKIAEPNYGLITNIGTAHAGLLGGHEGVKTEKGALYEFIRKKSGKIFIDYYDPVLNDMAKGMDKITYGFIPKKPDKNEFSRDIHAVDGSGKFPKSKYWYKKNIFCIAEFADNFPFVKLKYTGIGITTHFFGKHNFQNILAAICIGKYFGIQPEQIREAVESFIPDDNRSEIRKTKRKNTLILDAYNANPDSMKSMLESFFSFQKRGMTNKTAILGEMRELGEYEIDEHIKIIKLCLQSGFRKIYLTGKIFQSAMAESEIKDNRLVLFATTAEVIAYFRKKPLDHTVILLKGSRAMRLEELVRVL